MHLYCDESGGTDGEIFCVAALWLDPHAATRIIKTFRRRERWRGEVKGHGLTARQRVLLLDLASRSQTAGAVIICDTRTTLGGWAARTFVPEAALRRELLAEACVAAMQGVPGERCRAITVDGGRYTRAVLAEERLHLEGVLRQRGFLQAVRSPRISHEPSERHAGLQCADVLANTVYRILRVTEPGTAPSLDGLPPSVPAVLDMHHIILADHRPNWVDPPPY